MEKITSRRENRVMAGNLIAAMITKDLLGRIGGTPNSKHGSGPKPDLH
jgi:hypothetical protein